jgi:hypothetical protein
MTNREAQLKAYREYQNALHQAEKKKPAGSVQSTRRQRLRRGKADLRPRRGQPRVCLGRAFFQNTQYHLKAFQVALDSLFQENS